MGAFKIGNVSDLFTIESASVYYNFLASSFNEVELWETSYTHIFDSHQAIFDMIHSTGLRPCLNGLNTSDEIKEFNRLVYEGIVEDYSAQPNGKVLFPFIRQFIIAKN